MIATATESRWMVLVTGEQTNGRFAVIETRELQGARSPAHVHSREDEIVYVLDGLVTFNVDGERIDGPAGTCLFLPRGAEHTFAVESTDARMLVMLSPAGLEHHAGELNQCGEPASGQHFIEQLVATAARYGVSITGPSRHS